jgi:hypothetical protein
VRQLVLPDRALEKLRQTGLHRILERHLTKPPLAPFWFYHHMGVGKKQGEGRVW